MVSKKSLFAVLLFGTLAAHAIEQEEIKYFLEYEREKIEISLDGLKESEKLKDLWKKYKDDDKNNEEYSTFHDVKGNFKIPLNTLLDKIKKVKVDLYDIQIFIMLSEKTINMEGFTLPLIIRQINLANILNNQNILDKAAEPIAKEIRKEKNLLDFLNGKGPILTIINELSDDFLNYYVLKKKPLEEVKIPSRKLTGHTDIVKSVALSANGKLLASGSEDTSIIIWDLITGKIIKKLEDHKSFVNSVAFSPNGKLLASGSFDKTIIIWDTQTGKIIKKFEGHTIFVNSVAFSHNGEQLASGSNDSIIILDIKTGKIIKKLEGHTGWVNSVAFSLDGKKLASGSDDYKVITWDTKTGKIINTLMGHTNWVNSVAFSLDGKKLASGSFDKTVRIWNTKTGKIIKVLSGHTDSVNSVAWSPYGKLLASGSLDKTIIIWNTETGKIIKTLRGHTGSVNSIALSLDGTKLASGSLDKTIRVWYLDLFNNITTFQQIVTMLALQIRYKQTKISFDATKNKKIFEIIKTFPEKKIVAMKEMGWIRSELIDSKRISLLEKELTRLDKKTLKKEELLSIKQNVYTLRKNMKTLYGMLYAQEIIPKILVKVEKRMKKAEKEKHIE